MQPNNQELKDMTKVAQEIMSGKKNIKYRKSPENIMYIRGNTEEPRVLCENCRKLFYKNNARQIVYFCSKKCKKEYEPSEFKVIK